MMAMYVNPSFTTNELVKAQCSLRDGPDGIKFLRAAAATALENEAVALTKLGEGQRYAFELERMLEAERRLNIRDSFDWGAMIIGAIGGLIFAGLLAVYLAQ